MTGKRDPLEGYRGERPAELRREIEAEVSRHGTPEDDRYKTMVLGIQAEKLRKGLATVEDVGRVMGWVIEQCEKEARASMALLIREPSLETARARELHVNAAIASGILTLITELIESGRNAGISLAQDAEET